MGRRRPAAPAARRGLLPRGDALPASVWDDRHRLILRLLWAHVPVLAIAAGAAGYPVGHVVLHGLPIISCAVLAGSPLFSRRVRSVVAALGLLTCSALLVHTWHGATEAHFHFFVVIVLLTLYEDWTVFLVAVGYVFVHHALMSATGTAAAVYGHPGNPWAWAAIHGGFVAAAGVAGLVAWHFNEAIREESRRSTEEFRSTFEHAPIGMAIVTLDGVVTEANAALEQFLGHPDLQGMSLSEVTHPGDLARDARHMRRLLDGRVSRYVIEKRYVRGDREVVWGRLSVSLVHTREGRPSHFLSQVVDIDERKRLEARLRELAEKDPLTGLANRRRFEHELSRQGSIAERHGTPAAVLVIDLNGFKAVNDRCGHAVGDEVLRTVAAALAGRVRTSDLVARIGGDEFAVVLPHTDLPEAGRVGAALVSAIADATAGQLGRASVGAAAIVSRAGVRQALVLADKAMYAQKAAARPVEGPYEIA